MFHRVETCFPIKSKKIRDRLINDLKLYLADNTHAWLLSEDGSYHLAHSSKDINSIDAQAILLDRWSVRITG